MKIIAKVVDDNGYKLELIRPVKDAALRVGTKVEVEISKDRVDLIHLFEGVIDEDTQNAILDKFKKAGDEVRVP